MVAEHPSPISRRLKTLLTEYLVGASVLREIEDIFEGARITPQPVPSPPSGQRRAMVAEYYAGLNWAEPGDVRKFLTALTTVLREADRLHEIALGQRGPWTSSPEPVHPAAKLLDELRYCGFDWRDGAIILVSASARLADAKALAEKFDLTHLGEHIQRIERSIDTDPALAIGSAKELVETVAKTILGRRGVAYGPHDDLLDLGKAVFKLLKQVPDDVPDAARGAAVIKRTLSNLASVVQGIAELRGLYGTGHGKDGKRKGLGARHARLVVGAATALAVYWADTDAEASFLG